MTGPDPFDHAWWLASRASGVVAFALLSLSVLLGLMLATKILGRPKLNRTLVSLHEHMALGGLVAIAVHGLTLLGDPWLDPGPVGILVPFAMDYRPLFTGLGILGGLLAVGLGLSFYVRRRIGARRWRQMHRFTLLVWVLGVIHTLGAGTDASTLWMRAILLLTGAPIVFLTLVRWLPAPGPAPARAKGNAQRAGAAR